MAVARRFSLVLAVVLLVGLAACSGKPDTIRIGAIAPFTGDGAIYGHAARTGIDLAVDEVNAQGGANGRRLQIIYEDDKGSPKDAVSAFQKLATVDRVPAVLGPFYSGNVLACAPEADRLKVVLLTGSATSDNIRNAGDYVFRVCPTNAAQAKTIADFAYRKLGLKSAFVLYRNVEYGVTLRDAFTQYYKGIGGKIVGIEAVAADATDARAQLAKIKSVRPPFVFAAVHAPEGAVVLRQAKELGLSAVFIGTDGGFDPQLLRSAGDAAEDSYWATIGWADAASNPTVASFKSRYRSRFGEDPGSYSGLYYDALHVLAQAIASAGPGGPTAIQKSLLSVSYQGPTGLNKFDALGEVDKAFAIYQVKQGAFAQVTLGSDIR